MEKYSINFIIIVVVFTNLCCRATEQFRVQDLLRSKRSLLFPDPLDSETKVQVLFGLGIPMEGAISMTMGYVLKCNYDLPYNASVFTEPYIRYERSAVDKFATSEDATGEVHEEESEGRVMSTRWSIYRMLEIAMGTFGGGRACLLRAICEAAETPFKEDHGLLGEFLHVLLTPSTTSEKHETYTDREFRAAEILGGTSGGNCRSLFPECQFSPLDYFTDRLILGLGLPMEGGLIVGYVIKSNYNLPYNATFFSDPYIRYQRSVHDDHDPSETQTYVNSKGSISRWETYKMFESAFNIFGSGKSCLLRAICEAAREPFNDNHGLLGELLHLFLTPSTTAEEFFESQDQEYFAAESLGRRSSNECQKFATECATSPLEYFTESAQ